MSEDCLTLNVFRPSGVSKNEKLRVLFWIYGGGFTGTLDPPAWYNATNLVTKSVERGTSILYASANYRLGPLGFPQGAEAGLQRALNLGSKDQLIGLEWIQQNIDAFGGDPKKILESNAAEASFPPEKNEVSWQSFVVSITGCASVANTSDTFDRLHNASLESIMEGFFNMADGSFGPTIDGPDGVLPGLPSRLKPKTEFPLITGSVKDEWDIIHMTTNKFNGTNPSKFTQFFTLCRWTLGSSFGTGNNTFGLNSTYKRNAAILGDIKIQGLRRLTSKQRSMEGIKIFNYLFTDPDAVPMSFLVSNNPPPSTGSLGVSLDPNDGKGSERPKWRQYSPTDQAILRLDGRDGVKMIPDNFRAEQLVFLSNDPAVFDQ
ncbi:hypothetical protein M422DRAFT_263421 [Sphaerobolus stellatus SS14]|uniref:Carboxylesterase type B domain-containing protein n=1 Tax=Sphaerobolus stellatus (strain SS14) TaxID=990650 RepID=A0A0C9TVW1_SPHS4|nr:hypothetical protein M422DRAFT_263421 [Sphaerobolus stellatus SS14]